MTDKPIKATLDSSDDSVKTQKPILIQLDDIPTPTSDDAGKVLEVDAEGKYALREGGGGGKLYLHKIKNANGFQYIYIINSKSTAMTKSEVIDFLKSIDCTNSLTIYPVAHTTSVSNNKLYIDCGVYGTGTSLIITQSVIDLTVTNNTISFAATTVTITSITDTIVEL